MWNYLFEVVSEWSENCGEQFFVQCDTRKEADELNKFGGDYFVTEYQAANNGFCEFEEC